MPVRQGGKSGSNPGKARCGEGHPAGYAVKGRLDAAISAADAILTAAISQNSSYL